MNLRKYQKKDYKLLKANLKMHQHILFGAATGYGKSAIIYNKVESDINKGKRVLVIAPRRKLVKQLENTLFDFLPSIIMGSDTRYYKNCELYIASTATLHNRLKKYGKEYFGKIDTIIIDETHINFGSTSMKILYDLYWKKAQWVGLSATPIDERGYRLEGWDHTIYEHQTNKLIKKGWLTPVRVLVEDRPKGLDDLKMTGGDYNEGDLSEFMMDGARVSNIYNIWKKYARDRKVMVFAVSINHADMIYNDFMNKGVAAAVVHSNLDETLEDQSIQDFKNGGIDVLINVGKLTTGFDETSVDCLIMARPTKSLRLYMQIIGRGLRKHRGKKECLILDVAGTIAEHGYPTMNRDFNKVRPAPRERNETELNEIECPKCGYQTQLKNCRRKLKETKEITRTRWYCPNCDEIIKEVLVDNKKIKRMKEIADYTNIDKVGGEEVFNLIAAIQKHKGYKNGWIAYMAKDYKKSKEFRREVKIIYNKWHLGMVKLNTALTNINKARAEYIDA